VENPPGTISEASGKCRTSKAAPIGAAFLRLQAVLRIARPAGVCVGVPYTKVHLPASGLPCSIGIAYQAADAGHPGSGRASSPRSSKLAVKFNSYEAADGESSYRKGIT
jgi:hypothetical protein